MTKLLFENCESFYNGVAQSAFAPLCAHIAKNQENNVFVICESLGDCENFYSKFNAFLKLENVDFDLYIFPPHSTGEKEFEVYCERASVIGALKENDKKLIVLTTTEGLFEKFPMPENESHKTISVGDKISISKLGEVLGVEMQYYNELLCEAPAQYSVRGGIVDIYPATALTPYRVDFFGDKIESIKTFDPDTQLSIAKVDSVRLESADYKEAKECSLCEFIKKKTSWIFLEPAFLYAKTPIYFLEDEYKTSQKNFGKFIEKNDNFFGLSSIKSSSGIFDGSKEISIQSLDMAQYTSFDFYNLIGSERFVLEQKAREDFIAKLEEWKNQNYEIFIEANSKSDEKLIRETLKKFKSKVIPKFVEQFFSSGFLVDFENVKFNWKNISENAKGIVVLSLSDFFGRRNKMELSPRRKARVLRKEFDSALDFSELSEGDYLVHLGHGICRYCGVVKLENSNAVQESIKLEFDEKAFLYLPLQNAHLLSRYISLNKAFPKLSKLDSKSWVKVRSDAEKASFDYASELLEIQSKREISKGVAFPKDDELQNSFDDYFPFTETPDQLRAINEVKADMESEKSMDRLICADVGFGKTEIAMRAAFKCALTGMQVAILCPTTILCQQHFRNFKDRFAPFPVIIESLSRFKSAKESTKIKKQLSEGKIDIIIGTHALLNESVHFKNLGLLVIDEEHRFGVKSKERIKKIKENVDLLTMSATPIPRTLYFAMMGAKQMSLIETPPKDRFPIETIVKDYSDESVKTAIEREIARKGQVFYLHNTVKTIDACAEKLRAMFPDLRIAVGHGRLNESALEKLMYEFMDGKYDILVCTTIIESGLDIPNCNTIIIEGADRFGLSQLYQLRGRVGRFTRQAYAYLFLKKFANIMEIARKRLGAIRQYNKAGAGFRIAARDLQLRGCGNILGARQSGHIAGVGFDLYCSLLKQSIARLRGETTSFAVNAKLDLDFIKFGEFAQEESKKEKFTNAKNFSEELELSRAKFANIEKTKALISEKYIPQIQVRIDMYRKIALVASEEELKKLIDTFIDRFGKIPPETKRLFSMAKIRLLAQANLFSKVETLGNILKLRNAFGGKDDFFKLANKFPILTKSSPDEKLLEIENFLRYTVKSIKK